MIFPCFDSRSTNMILATFREWVLIHLLISLGWFTCSSLATFSYLQRPLSHITAPFPQYSEIAFNYDIMTDSQEPMAPWICDCDPFHQQIYFCYDYIVKDAGHTVWHLPSSYFMIGYFPKHIVFTILENYSWWYISRWESMLWSPINCTAVLCNVRISSQRKKNTQEIPGLKSQNSPAQNLLQTPTWAQFLLQPFSPNLPFTYYNLHFGFMSYFLWLFTCCIHI